MPPGAPVAATASSANPLEPFALERFFAKWEFTAEHQLCCSDSEPLTMAELLAMADADSLRRWNSLSLAYTETAGLPALREAIAAMHYTSMKADQIVVAAPQEAIYLCMTALLRPGDRVVCCYPGYQSLYSIAKSLGCEVVYWELSRPDGSAPFFDLADAQRLITPGTRLVVVNSPHNPSGAHFSHQEWSQLFQLCQSSGAYVFSDEMYLTLEHDPADRLTAAVDMPGAAASLSGVSKAVGGPGLRIGWLACKDADLLARVMQLKDYTTICSSAPSEVLALICLSRWDVILRRQLSVIHANLELLDKFFYRWQQVFEWHQPRAGTIAFPRLLTGEEIGAWCEDVVRQTGVLLLPGTVYDSADVVDSCCEVEGRFRLGFGRRNLQECLDRLDPWLIDHYVKSCPASLDNIPWPPT